MADPPLQMGWHKRRQSKRWRYDRVAREFAEREIGIDPWRINPAFGCADQINFQERTGEECLAAQVDLCCPSRGVQRYGVAGKEYGVTDEPGGRE